MSKSTNQTQNQPQPKFRTYYTARQRQPSTNWGESMTDPSQAAMRDINWIASMKDRNPEILQQRQAIYGDAVTLQGLDYQGAHEIIQHATNTFARLPATVRDAFGNTAQNFIAALDDPGQRAKLVELGIFSPPAAPPIPAGGQPARTGTEPVQAPKGASNATP